MSYILEALKKIERKRQKAETGSALIWADSADPGSRSKPLWPYLVALGLILNAGILVWWLAQRGSAVTAKPMVAPAVQGAPAQAPPPTPSAAASRAMIPPLENPAPAPPPSGSAPVLEKRPSQPLSPAERTAVSGPVEKPAPLPVKKEEPTPKPPQQTIQAAVAENRPPQPPLPAERAVVSEPVKKPTSPPLKKEAPRTDRVFHMNELPADVRSALPTLKVSAHVYSPEPPSRLVRINDQILQEGQGSSEDLKVEEILPNGVILLFQGYRFKMSVP